MSSIERQPGNPERGRVITRGLVVVAVVLGWLLVLVGNARAQATCAWTAGEGGSYALPVPSTVADLCAVKLAEWAAAAPGGGYTVHYCQQTTDALHGVYSITWTDGNTYTFTFVGEPACAGEPEPGDAEAAEWAALMADRAALVVIFCGGMLLFGLGVIGGVLR